MPTVLRLCWNWEPVGAGAEGDVGDGGKSNLGDGAVGAVRVGALSVVGVRAEGSVGVAGGVAIGAGSVDVAIGRCCQLLPVAFGAGLVGFDLCNNSPERMRFKRIWSAQLSPP